MIVIRLITMTTMPTAKNIFFTGSFAVSMAEKGAVMMPPKRRPATIFQCFMPMINTKSNGAGDG